MKANKYLCKFVRDYTKHHDLPDDHMFLEYNPVRISQQINPNDCGICVCIIIYCYMVGIDIDTVDMAHMVSRGRLFITHTVLGWKLNQSDEERQNQLPTELQANNDNLIDLTDDDEEVLGLTQQHRVGTHD